jgi:hypothetical protein
MGLNPHQRIIINDEQIQQGNVDTPAKFAQMMQGLDLNGKTLLDCGCNLGMMCNLAAQQGAIPLGIDINRDYLAQAKSLFPHLTFQFLPIDGIYGNFDIILASAVLHYLKDLDSVFLQFARCAKLVVCDIWLNDSPEPIFALTHRGMYVPSRSAFYNIVGKYFEVIEDKGPSMSPDISKRYLFHLSKPHAPRAKAILISGPGGVGKTTLASTYIGYRHLQTDSLFHTWKVVNMDKMFSVAFFTSLARGNLRQEYLDFLLKTLSDWLGPLVNRDLVLEGYELMFDDFRNRVLELLSGWDVEEIKLGG